MGSLAIPVISSLGALAELAAQLARSQDLAHIAAQLNRSTKWLLPVEGVEMWEVCEPGLRVWPGAALRESCASIRAAIERTTTVVSDTAMHLPLLDGNELLGVLVLRFMPQAQLADFDRGICHLLALQVASGMRAVKLLERAHAARLRAELATRTRDRLIASLTHDLRNPLGVLASIIELTIEDNPDALPQADKDDIHSSLRQMRWLIDELLDAAKVEAGKELTLRLASCDVCAIVRTAASAIRAQLRSVHSLHLEIPREAIPGRFDEPRLTRVIANLLSNAVKYSPGGGVIELIVARCPDGIEIRVSDHGLGIPETHLPRLFERFQRADNVGAITGTGIGLSSSRDIVRAHGGELTVATIEGQGSTFVVRLPIG